MRRCGPDFPARSVFGGMIALRADILFPRHPDEGRDPFAFALARFNLSKVKMDSGLRRNDDG